MIIFINLAMYMVSFDTINNEEDQSNNIFAIILIILIIFVIIFFLLNDNKDNDTPKDIKTEDIPNPIETNIPVNTVIDTNIDANKNPQSQNAVSPTPSRIKMDTSVDNKEVKIKRAQTNKPKKSIAKRIINFIF